jgi:hypothetical protein
MKLILPEVLHHLEREPVLLLTAQGMRHASRGDSQRQAIVQSLMPLLHKAEKFIFDSGSDRDEQTVMAVRSTAVEMMHAGLLHLPHPVTWIEDPFDSVPFNPADMPLPPGVAGTEGAIALTRMLASLIGEQRYGYLCVEQDHKLFIHFLSYCAGPIGPRVTLALGSCVIDLANPQDGFAMPFPGSVVNAMTAKVLGEAVYGVKKFLVTLATEQAERASVPGKRWSPGAPKRTRRYDHTIVRVPLDAPHSVSGESGDDPIPQGRRRKHLVRGYMWGRNTRPTAQQRWIKPFWRGDADLGTLHHEHYEIAAA